MGLKGLSTINVYLWIFLMTGCWCLKWWWTRSDASSCGSRRRPFKRCSLLAAAGSRCECHWLLWRNSTSRCHTLQVLITFVCFTGYTLHTKVRNEHPFKGEYLPPGIDFNGHFYLCMGIFYNYLNCFCVFILVKCNQLLKYIRIIYQNKSHLFTVKVELKPHLTWHLFIYTDCLMLLKYGLHVFTLQMHNI